MNTENSNKSYNSLPKDFVVNKELESAEL